MSSTNPLGLQHRREPKGALPAVWCGPAPAAGRLGGARCLRGGTGCLVHRGRQLDRWITGTGQLVAPAGYQVPNPIMAFSVSSGPSGDGPGAVGGLWADSIVDLGSAGGVNFPRLFGDATDGPATGRRAGRLPRTQRPRARR